MRRGPETRMTGERPAKRTMHRVGRKIGRCDFPTAEEEAAAPRHAPNRIVLLALCAVIVPSMTGPSERDTVSIVSPYLRFHNFSRPTEKHDCDRYFVIRS